MEKEDQDKLQETLLTHKQNPDSNGRVKLLTHDAVILSDASAWVFLVYIKTDFTESVVLSFLKDVMGELQKIDDFRNEQGWQTSDEFKAVTDSLFAKYNAMQRSRFDAFFETTANTTDGTNITINDSDKKKDLTISEQSATENLSVKMGSLNILTSPSAKTSSCTKSPNSPSHSDEFKGLMSSPPNTMQTERGQHAMSDPLSRQIAQNDLERNQAQVERRENEKSLKKILFWRSVKIKLIFLMILASILLYILIPLATK
eukprot:TRINITY_DN6016_c0_g1_i1.p1 TRINITY_DN6016_c0_g1~~TRINITY_DN6016_c0_g1_i1.p1  ORF type:complete len:259 (+),score=27.44 TRINITY_DN6016_c0_g1_i1:437-1213(+)